MKPIPEPVLLLGKCSDLDMGFNKKRLVTFLNPYSYLIARCNVDSFCQFDEIHCDGFVLANLMALVGNRCHRVSFDMTSLAPVVFHDASESGMRIYFVGSEPGVADKAVEKIKSEYPVLLVCGVRHGYFSSSCERENFIEELANQKPDIVVVGMGAPLQERFLIDLRNSGWEGIGYTCGGFFHQTARGGTQYYPEWMNRFNLRWIYRMIDEPKLVRRYFIDYPKFMVYFLYDVVCFHIAKTRIKSKG